MTTQVLSDRIAAVLAPHLGPLSADAVSRHLCAKFGVQDTVDADKIAALRDFLQRGLVAYVGAEMARTLAAECVAIASEGATSSPAGGQ
jgi:gamma-glutamylcysteine synthetase